MTRSVHDNHLFAYEVDSRSQRIILRTEYAYGEEPFERTDVIFEGVIDHYFRNTVLPSIVFDVDEGDPQLLIARDKEVIDMGHKIGGWPSFWKNTVEEMVSAISDRDCRIYEISSSFGLDGWVVARSCDFHPNNKK